MNYFGIKDLYDVTLKTTSNIEINGEPYEKNEPIISFDKIQIALLSEGKDRRTAQGGLGNQSLIFWEDTTEIDFQFSEGIISKPGIGILSNSQILRKNNEPLILPCNEVLESDFEEGKYVLNTKRPLSGNVFVRRNGERFKDFTWENVGLKGKILLNNVKDEEEGTLPQYVVYYDYEYDKGADICKIGQRAIKGFLSLTAKTRLKDDQSGKETTCFIEIPKIKLMSDLTMRLGSAVNPYVYGFNMTGFPVGERSSQYVCKITMLDRDIDCDF